MADYAPIVDAMQKTGAVSTKPSYTDWLTDYVQQYSSKFGESDLGLGGPGGFSKDDVARYTQELSGNKGLRSIYDQGVTVQQMVNAPLQGDSAHIFDNAGGFDNFKNKPYGELTPEQQGMVDKGWFAWTYNPTLQGVQGAGDGEHPGGYYWAQTEKAPKVLGKYDTGSFTNFNPFNANAYSNSGKVVFDPNYGLVTTQQNVKKGKFDEIGYQLGPMAAIMIMTMGAGAALTAGGAGAAASGVGGLTEAQLGSLMLKIPSLAQTIGSGGNPFSAILSFAANASGVPGAGIAANLLSSSLAKKPSSSSSTGGNSTTQQSSSGANPFAFLMALAAAKQQQQQGGGGHG